VTVNLTLLHLGLLSSALAFATLGGAACDGDSNEAPATTTVSAGGSGGASSAGGSVGGSVGEGGSTDGGGGTVDPGPVTSPGCVDGAGLAEGEHTFMLENLSRRFMVRLPNNYTRDAAWPVVLALHGNGGSVSYWDSTSGSRNIRDVLQDDAVLIIAEAIDGQWRDYNMPSSSWPARIESELLYFEEVLTQAKNELCVNEEAIFSMGFSGGGSFSGVLGCRRTDIRAIAVGGSVIYFDEQNCVNTPAAWITIGTMEMSSGRAAYRDFFRDRAMCSDTNMPTDPMPCVAYDGCDAATPVHYCQHPDGHIWPDFGSAAMWAFFDTFVQ
jgi:polyhydroxybutyrate depolymerase